MTNTRALEEIKQREDKENAAFLRWIKSPAFQLQSHGSRTTDLEIYMLAKNREIGDLQAENAAQAKRIVETMSLLNKRYEHFEKLFDENRLCMSAHDKYWAASDTLAQVGRILSASKNGE